MPLINRNKIKHVILSYLSRAYLNARGSSSSVLEVLANYRYGGEISMLPILDKSNPFLCTVFLFDGRELSGIRDDHDFMEDSEQKGDAPQNQAPTIGSLRFVSGFYIDPSFANLDLTYNFDNKDSGGLMLKIKEKVFGTIQSFFKDDPAVAGASMAALKDVGIMNFIGSIFDLSAESVSRVTGDLVALLSNGHLYYPEKYIARFEGFDLELDNLTVTKYYFCSTAKDDPYDEAMKDLHYLKLLPLLYDPVTSFSFTENAKSALDSIKNATKVDAGQWKDIEEKTVLPFLKVVEFVHYYNNMAMQAYALGAQGLNPDLKVLIPYINTAGEVWYDTGDEQYLSTRIGVSSNVANMFVSYNACLTALGLQTENKKWSLGPNALLFKIGKDNQIDNGSYNEQFANERYLTHNAQYYQMLQMIYYMMVGFYYAMYEVLGQKYFFVWQETDQSSMFEVNTFFLDNASISAERLSTFVEHITEQGSASQDQISSLYIPDEARAKTLREYAYSENDDKNFATRLSDFLWNLLHSIFTTDLYEEISDVSYSFFLRNSMRFPMNLHYLDFCLYLRHTNQLGIRVYDSSKNQAVLDIDGNTVVGDSGVQGIFMPFLYRKSKQEVYYYIIDDLINNNKENHEAENIIAYIPVFHNMPIPSDESPNIVDLYPVYFVLFSYGSFWSYNSTLSTILLKTLNDLLNKIQEDDDTQKAHIPLSNIYNHIFMGAVVPIFRFDKSSKMSKVLNDYVEHNKLMNVYKTATDKDISKNDLVRKMNITMSQHIATKIFGRALITCPTENDELDPLSAKNIKEHYLFYLLQGAQTFDAIPNSYSLSDIYAYTTTTTMFASLKYVDETYVNMSKILSKMVDAKYLYGLLLNNTGNDFLDYVNKQYLNNQGDEEKNSFKQEVISNCLVNFGISFLKSSMQVLALMFVGPTTGVRRFQIEYAKIANKPVEDKSTNTDGAPDAVFQQGIYKDTLKILYPLMMFSGTKADTLYSVQLVSKENDMFDANKAIAGNNNTSKAKVWFNLDMMFKDKTPVLEYDNIFPQLYNTAGSDLSKIDITDSSMNSVFAMFQFGLSSDVATVSDILYQMLLYIHPVCFFSKLPNESKRLRTVFMNYKIRQVIPKNNAINEINRLRAIRHSTDTDNNQHVLINGPTDANYFYAYMSTLFHQQVSNSLIVFTDGSRALDEKGNSVGTENQGVQVTRATSGLADIFKLFNVLLLLPPGHYYYVPYIKHFFKALIDGHKSVTINNVTYYIGYYGIVLHNVNAIALRNNQEPNRVLMYLLPKNVKIQVSESYTYPFNFPAEIQNQNNKARPLYVKLDITFMPINDLLYLYSTYSDVEQLKRVLGIGKEFSFFGLGSSSDSTGSSGSGSTTAGNQNYANCQ